MQMAVINFEIEHAGKAVFSSTGTSLSLSAKPKHFVVTVPAASLYAQLIPGNLFLIVSKSFIVANTAVNNVVIFRFVLFVNVL